MNLRALRVRNPAISLEQVSLLGWTCELRKVADDEQQATVSLTEAELAIADASRLLDTATAMGPA